MPISFALLALQAVSGESPAQPTPPLPRYGIVIERTFPHDAGAFTEGLFFLKGYLYESTGVEGRSSIRKVCLENGKIVGSAAFPPALFGEGIVNWKNDIVGVTWRSQIGFRWDLGSFRNKASFSYSGEGWGLTQDGESLILSDGTAELRFLDPVTLRERRRVTVTARGKPVRKLNELEWVKGEILANVWQRDLIVRIDPASGAVTGVIDVSELARLNTHGSDDVLNGIAYDSRRDRLFVTGKNWPHLYQIRLTPVMPNATAELPHGQ
jgi:glutaminyl-peptide cyclotransferase